MDTFEFRIMSWDQALEIKMRNTNKANMIKKTEDSWTDKKIHANSKRLQMNTSNIKKLSKFLIKVIKEN